MRKVQVRRVVAVIVCKYTTLPHLQTCDWELSFRSSQPAGTCETASINQGSSGDWAWWRLGSWSALPQPTDPVCLSSRDLTIRPGQDWAIGRQAGCHLFLTSAAHNTKGLFNSGRMNCLRGSKICFCLLAPQLLCLPSPLVGGQTGMGRA